MKKVFLSAMVAFALCAGTTMILHAQDTPAPQEQTGAHHWPTPEEVVARMDAKLSLTDDQKAKITPIITERQEKMKELADSSGRRRKKGREMKSIMADSDAKINAVLNADQKKKYAEMEADAREHARERRQERRSGGGQ